MIFAAITTVSKALFAPFLREMDPESCVFMLLSISYPLCRIFGAFSAAIFRDAYEPKLDSSVHNGSLPAEIGSNQAKRKGYTFADGC